MNVAEERTYIRNDPDLTNSAHECLTSKVLCHQTHQLNSQDYSNFIMRVAWTILLGQTQMQMQMQMQMQKHVYLLP